MGPVTAVFVAFLAAAIPLAVGVTKATDLIRNLVDSGGHLPKVTWNIVPFLLGVGLCIGWQFDPAGALAHAVPALATSGSLDGVAGQLLSGLAVGAMAGFWHEKLSAWSAQSPSAPAA